MQERVAKKSICSSSCYVESIHHNARWRATVSTIILLTPMWGGYRESSDLWSCVIVNYPFVFSFISTLTAFINHPPSTTISSSLLHQSSSFSVLYQMTKTNLQLPSSPSRMMTTSFISISCDRCQLVFPVFSLSCASFSFSYFVLFIFRERNVMVNPKPYDS